MRERLKDMAGAEPSDLLMGPVALRIDEPDAVHQLRVAARRMRSVLATYRKLIDTFTANHPREELKWMAGTVGQARDVEVMRERLKDMAGAEPSDLLMGPVALRI
ncbi:metal-binding protein, partial [Methylobacterium radiotolerans]